MFLYFCTTVVAVVGCGESSAVNCTLFFLRRISCLLQRILSCDEIVVIDILRFLAKKMRCSCEEFSIFVRLKLHKLNFFIFSLFLQRAHNFFDYV